MLVTNFNSICPVQLNLQERNEAKKQKFKKAKTRKNILNVAIKANRNKNQSNKCRQFVI